MSRPRARAKNCQWKPRPGSQVRPHQVVVDSRGVLYVADRNSGRIQLFDQEGKFLDQWTNCQAQGFAAEFVDARHGFTVPARRLLHDVFQSFSEFSNLVGNARLFPLWQPGEVVRAHWFAIFDWRKRESMRRT